MQCPAPAPWWATISGNVAGSARGPNVAPKDYVHFANYATDVVLHYARAWGVAFSSWAPSTDPFENNLKGVTAQGAAAGEACGFKLTQIPFVLECVPGSPDKEGAAVCEASWGGRLAGADQIAFTTVPAHQGPGG